MTKQQPRAAVAPRTSAKPAEIREDQLDRVAGGAIMHERSKTGG